MKAKGKEKKEPTVINVGSRSDPRKIGRVLAILARREKRPIRQPIKLAVLACIGAGSNNNATKSVAIANDHITTEKMKPAGLRLLIDPGFKDVFVQPEDTKKKTSVHQTVILFPPRFLKRVSAARRVLEILLFRNLI